MLSINIIAVGNLKDRFFEEACAEYAKRISGYAKFRFIELKEARLSQNPTEGEIKKALAAEGEDILSRLSPRARNIAMCIEGKQMSTEAFAAYIDGAAAAGTSELNFIIGSSYGLCDEVKQKCDLRLSMSVMTFPHRLARVMLCEAVYRALTVCAGTPYHK